ncbi:Zn-dependent hydrolase [Pseudotabrizicola algicola]|uniref:Zn-dependent hydrolase n=1 Tax=Pseudotabrizicola algicola TaxID=2709381 RepID=A0A6B3RTE9_9RHOB|nr:Zn-dependent hydrolase [Pseudotabrizicola algicola]NEX48653.1 Zn-dependent hydrolase [Pseudotabrizicola algicola]
MPDTTTLAQIDAPLFDRLMEKVSEFGSTGDGGVDRPALTDAHKAARDWLCAEFRQRGYSVLTDSVGNLFGRLDLAGDDAPLVMVGSHLDSQPKGGRFDGAYGVIAGLVAIESWRAHCARNRITPRCNYVVADWMNEEGARFQPSLLGSSVFTGALDREFALSRKDRDGVSVEAELIRTGYMGGDDAPRPDCYIEVHIEGDSHMERSGAKIAPFVRHWGAIKLRIEVEGKQNHTGPTPMEDRQDALLGAAYIIAKVRELADQSKDTLYTSVARVDVTPNSPNVVPGKAVLFAELRAPEPATLSAAEAALRAALPELARRAFVTAEVVGTDIRPAGKFDARLVALAEQAADRFALPRMRLDTIAGHDAVALNAVLPSLVLAVPSVNGVIHRNDEYTSPEDLKAGAGVVLDMIRRIDQAGGCLDTAAEAK